MSYLKLFRKIINEGFKQDASNWVLVGEVEYKPFITQKEDKLYIMVNPQKIQYADGTERYEVVYTENPDGSGNQIDAIPVYYRDSCKIYPEHENDEYGAIFLGKKKNEEIAKKMHNEFLSKLFIKDGFVILHHNSSIKITDGSIKRGEPNRWSNNSDVGIYFWASENSGRDPSGSGSYTYFCRIRLNDLYDFQTNVERLTLSQAMSKYGYAGQYWRKGEAVCVNTHRWTRIWCIRENSTGKWYDRFWKEIEKPF